MGLFDKIKNFFYDEEEIVVNKSKEPKEEPNKVDTVVPVEPKPKEEPAKPPAKNNVEDVISERELFKSEPTFKFPIIFEDEDFVEEKKKNNRMNVLDTENNKLKGEKTPSYDSEKKNFKPTPIISPIYGVLNKNYKKDDVTVKDDSLLNFYESNRKVSIDEVIEKAYGRSIPSETPSEEDSVVVSIKEEEPIDLFKNINENEPKEKSRTRQAKHADIDINIDEEEVTNNDTQAVDERLKSIDELLENTNDQDFYTLVDSMYKNDDEKGSE